MKKIWTLLVAAITVLAVLTSGCGSSDKAAKPADGKKTTTIGFSISTLNNPFFVSVRKGVEEEAKKLGVNVKIVDAQNDPAKQANDISDLIQQKVDVLLINPVDSAAVSTSVAAANKASIPVLALDRSADKGTVASFIASDNVKGGEMAAEYIIQKLGEKVKVAELEGIPGASATRERGEGFHKVADQKLTVVAKQSADFDRSKGLTVSENMLQANPDIQAIFAQNDEMALGAIEAAKSANKKIFIVGFDGTQDGLKAVEAGVDIIDTAMSPFALGTSQPATEVMVETFKGTPYDTGFDQKLLAEIADYFRPIRDDALDSGLLNPKNLGVNIKTLLYQVPGGMLSNLTSQLKEQHAEDKFYDVLEEVPKVRKDLGEPPLVTPSSQIVGTQAVFNVLMGERYKMVTKETKDILLGKYGATVKPFNQDVQKKCIGDAKPITCRPADLLDNELDKLETEMSAYKEQDEDVLSYALFPQVATDFFKYRQAQEKKVDEKAADTENGAYPV